MKIRISSFSPALVGGVALLTLPLALLAVGCSADDDPNAGMVDPVTGEPVDGSGDGDGGLGDGSTIGGDLGGTPTVSDGRDLPVREEVCDADGNCTCLRLALLGTLESAANDNDSSIFVDWLNDNSGGTATATMVSTKPTINAEWLGQFDILIVANVNDWTFSAEEQAAVETWARETGGGIISLTGFVSTAGEPAATSQLIEWSGVSYNSTTTAQDGQAEPVHYNGGSEDLKNCLSWTGGSDAIITTPIPFSEQSGDLDALSFELDYVGAYIGWGVDAPDGSTVVATDPVSGANMAVAHEVDGTGRVVAFGDEWIVFGNQWEASGDPHNTQMDEYNPCWHPAEGDAEGFYHSVQTLYQTKQFWFNAISWVAPPNECNFVVEDTDVVVK